MRRFVSLGLMAVLFMLVVPALQAQEVNVTGDWTITYTMQGRQGGPGREMSMDVTFQQEGTTVTGTALMAMPGRPGGGGGAPEPEPISLTDTNLEGDQLTFTVSRGMGERTFSQVFTATVAGNEMEGTVAMGGGMRGGGEPIPFTAVKKEG
ncbi:MAG: hypothetical protein PVJ76_10180 [Gemmatimonadota bacterium]|jgi:hypothetical protein